MTEQQAAAFRAGDERVFAELVETHSPRLLGAALTLTRDRGLAHELVHDTWVDAYRRRHAFGAKGSFLGWLLAIQRNHWLEFQRAAGRTAARDTRYGGVDADSTGVEDSVLAGIDATRHRSRLLQALHSLTERQRDVLVLRVLEDRTTVETARQLGVAEGTVKATLSQALQRLRANYQKEQHS